MQQTSCVFLSVYLFIEVKRTTNAINLKNCFVKIKKEKGDQLLKAISMLPSLDISLT